MTRASALLSQQFTLAEWNRSFLSIFRIVIFCYIFEIGAKQYFQKYFCTIQSLNRL